MSGRANADRLPDEADRLAALTELDRSLLVEAGAGSGKTAIMAGRVAMLFARGIHPKRVAAITFTEFAASELSIRISSFVDRLARREIPRELLIAFPDGLTDEQANNLASARGSLDQLLCTTIHGFAQALIKPYPVEADIDPGAEIFDPVEAELSFSELYDAWLRSHLSGEVAGGLGAELAVADEKPPFSLVRSVADFRRKNRDARTAPGVWSPDLFNRFAKAVADFQGMLSRLAFSDEKTAVAAKAFAGIAAAMDAGQMRAVEPSHKALLQCLAVGRPLACFTTAGIPRSLKGQGRWERAARAAGRKGAEGVEAYEAAMPRYEACHVAFEALMACAAGVVLERLSKATDGLLADWRDYKRKSARLDFDDLLYTARDLLAKHEDVRAALARRFPYILVDEFQDTDPLQIEILWRLCGEAKSAAAQKDPLKRAVRPGALFLVGDPKQAIYRFRGADVGAYVGARKALGEKSIKRVTTNFRSVRPILQFVNETFESPLSEAFGQPGFTSLAHVRKGKAKYRAVLALDVDDGGETAAHQLRDAEALRIAELCWRLVGNVEVVDKDDHGKEFARPCRLGDIALLAPVGTDLWRFEQALEERGVTVSTQAGKGFFRRQEIQDLIALARTLADGRDVMALCAFLRGPLVGLTERELLDIADALPIDPDRPERLPQLNLWTDPDHVPHALARTVLRHLQVVARRARSSTPFALLSDALGLLDVRALVRQRNRTGAERALANVDVFLEMARAYDVRGLRAFANDMRANWKEAVRQVEGRPDAEQQSVSLITVHGAKGLEWPIVIPVNMTGTPKAESGLMHDRRSETFSVPILGAEPRDYAGIKAWNEEELHRERVRLWYVAATRARDLLVLPRHSSVLKDGAYARIVEFDLPSLTAIDPDALGDSMQPQPRPAENLQTREVFADEASRIVAAHKTVAWLRPSRHEASEAPAAETYGIFSDIEASGESEPRAPVVGGPLRGTLLHKLMEEVLTGETGDDATALRARAKDLMAQLSITPADRSGDGISVDELAGTVQRTLAIPEIAALRPRLVPELTILGSVAAEQRETVVSGIADAVAYDASGRIEAIVDWKSDVAIDDARLSSYSGQLQAYRAQSGARQALLVLMTSGTVVRA